MKKSFVIDRAKWRCGGQEGMESSRGLGPVYLKNHQGFMCCLGQISQQCGIPETLLLEMETPGVLPQHDGISFLREGNQHSNVLAMNAMSINDAHELPDNEREGELTELFAAAGITLTFTGEYVK